MLFDALCVSFSFVFLISCFMTLQFMRIKVVRIKLKTGGYESQRLRQRVRMDVKGARTGEDWTEIPSPCRPLVQI